MSFSSLMSIDEDWTATLTNIQAAEDDTLFNVDLDIIALSCVAKRLKMPISPDSMGNLAKHIRAEDYLESKAIRTFYNGKLTVAQLRGDNITNFRRDLIRLLNTPMNEDGKYSYPKKFIGMIYKLPYFYEYDRSLIDDVFGSEYHDILKSIPNHNNKANVSLTFIRKMDARRKRLPYTEYWFMDELDNRVVLTVDKHNPLNVLLERHVESNDIRVEGYFIRDRKDTLNFYKVKYWTPVF